MEEEANREENGRAKRGEEEEEEEEGEVEQQQKQQQVEVGLFQAFLRSWRQLQSSVTLLTYQEAGLWFIPIFLPNENVIFSFSIMSVMP